MAEPYLVIDNIKKEFPRRTEAPLRVIDGLDVGVEKGALLSILGPSGCGKSTLLNIINGLDDVTSGRIVINGHEVSVKSRSKLKIGVVFQDSRLLPWRTVKDNVRLPLDELGIDRAEADRRVTYYLNLVGLGDFGDYFPLRLSGGMQQRVSLARGLAIEPDLLLADEPFSALDEITARKLRQEFISIWRATGRTVIFVTHNIREAVFLSTRMLVITPRPARTHLDLDIDVPYPRTPEDDRLFEIEKRVTRDFIAMEEASV
ncbi:ABC transporter ATP-binding protein [Geodermatophilus sabuli]|uniref:ABC transporter ATP-binding protein n=1 Tax=Geodermatophilus sabuli TaxID=1564158 RepID=A0A7K3W2N3_9ACTN|nr:ABC transporter ATP-binding protein [Geodermatophilus sabuli]NEK59115.1 ABC transporter ATP-binding protein [Geodermatophilus sabuli]